MKLTIFRLCCRVIFIYNDIACKGLFCSANDLGIGLKEWGESKKTPKERLTGQNRGGRGVGEEPYLFACPSLFRFSVASMLAASIVFKKLQEVNVAKATGHDNIANKIFKIAAPVISISLADLFKLSITTNTFPDDWKVAKVFPLFKSGERNDPNNFRPISGLTNKSQSF